MITDNGRIKCDLCGKFIPLNGEELECEYTPESEYTKEEIILKCKRHGEEK